jgi:[acyl-carrier-protein] S-malonyltransferase
MFEGPEEELTATENAQPAVVAASLASVVDLRERGAPDPDVVAGHSVGEYTALAAAGVLEPAQAVRLVRRRGELMAEAGRDGQAGTMAAVLGLDAGEVEAICAEVRDDAGVWPTNLNAPGQVVVSGTIEGVETASRLARARGAKRVVPLHVSGPFHCELMAAAADKLAEEIEATPMSEARVPVVQNWDAQPHTSPEEIRDGLRRHLVSGVRWQASVERMVRMGVEAFVEVGPGFPLGGMIRRIDRSVAVHKCVDWPE